MVQKQQEKKVAKQAKAETRARKEATKKKKQEASAGLSTSATADLLEAQQALERLAIPNQVTECLCWLLRQIQRSQRLKARAGALSATLSSLAIRKASN